MQSIRPLVHLLSAAVCLALAWIDNGSAQASEAASSTAVPSPEMRIVGKWHGLWEVKAVRRSPKPVQQITYDETFEWILDRRFLRAESSRKSDGSRSMAVFWLDALTKTYRWIYFDTVGYAVELPPPTWNEATQTMTWQSGSFSPTSYSARAVFKDADTIEWHSLWKDWKGSAILELEGVSRRRK